MKMTYKNKTYELVVLYNVFAPCAIIDHSRYNKMVDILKILI